MDDFINKVGWGLNLLFSNGVGWPRTRWLIKRRLAHRAERSSTTSGATRCRRQVWYKAYPGLALVELKRNQRIREGLEQRDDERCAGARLAEAAMTRRRWPVELDDIQGLVRFGYKHSPRRRSCCCASAIATRRARWLAAAPVRSAETVEPPPETALQIALTSDGLARPGRARRHRRRLRRTSSSPAWRATPTARAASATSARTIRAAGNGAPASACRTCCCCSMRCPGRLAGFEQSDRSAMRRRLRACWRRLADDRPATASSRSASWTASRSRCVDWERKRPARDGERAATTRT